jgi:hypothetical protein
MSGILGVDNVLFDVGDLGAAREHYAGLGLVERFAFPGIAGYALGDERPGLLLREVAGCELSGPRGPHLWLEVADVAGFAAEHGIVAEQRTIRTGVVVEVTDPWGNTLGFTDYSLDPARARAQDA